MLVLQHRPTGFSLVEVMIVVAIMGALLALAAPNYSSWIQNQQIRAAIESILNGLQVARSTAVNSNTTTRFVLCDLPLSSWQVFATSTGAAAPAADGVCGVGAANEIRVQDRFSTEGSSSAQVTVNGVAGTAISTVTFNSFGRVVANADASVTITQVDATTPTATRPMRVTLGTGGATRMCDPSPLLAASNPTAC